MPALIAAILFFMSGGDVVIIALAFALLLWSFIATRRAPVPPPDRVAAVVPPGDEAVDFLRAGIEWCQQMSGARRVVLWAVDDAAGLVRPISATGGAWPKAHVLHGSPVTWIARECLSSRIAPPPEWAETLRVMGVAVVQARSTHALTFELVDDIDVNPQQFEMLGIYLGALLNVLRDHEVLAAHQHRSDLLYQALRELPTTHDTGTLAQQLLGFAVRVTGGHGASLMAWNGVSGEVIAAEAAGLQQGDVVDDAESLTVLSARGAAILSKHGSALRKVHVISRKEKFLPTPDVATAVPLLDDGNVVGVLTVWAANTNRIDEAAISDLETIAPYAAARLQQTRQLGEMRQLADRDALTGLANRRAFDAQLLAEWARWERYHRPFSLLLFDIDHFKRVNDRFGHDAGDEVLRAVAASVTRLLRGSDFAARYGGEEFGVILSEASRQAAVEIAERLRLRIEELPISYRGQHIPVTISGGVVAAAEHLTAADIVRSADQLLYRAKAGGRNRIES
ncbi:MAG TPA: GGDEF domain-containing protein [Longimicrobiales bacterium]|nr:GGDEF domain-containing protein [Longimicrobiales bacterium]